MRNWIIFVLILSLIATPAIAQDQQDADIPATFIRAAHFAADVDEVDIYVDGDLVLESLTFPMVSDWIEVDAGTYTIEVVPTGEPLIDAVISTEYELNTGDWATLAAIGQAARNNLAIQPMIEDLGALDEELTQVGVFHAIPDLGSVDVRLNDEDLVRLLSYPGSVAGADGYSGDEVAPDTYNIAIVDQEDETVLALADVVMGMRRSYLIAAVGTADSPQIIVHTTDVGALLTDDEVTSDDVEVGTGQSIFRLGHFAVDAPQVDIYLNDDLYLEVMRFGDVTDYDTFEAGIYELVVVPTGEARANAILTQELAFVAGQQTLVSLVGFFENDTLQVVAASERAEAPEAGLTRIAFFQSIPSTDLFQLTANDNIIVQGVAFPEIFVGAGDGYAAIDILAGAYEFNIDGADNPINVGNVTTGAGRVYLIVSAGAETSPIFFLVSSDFPTVDDEEADEDQ